MNINIQPKGGVPIYTQISNQIKEQILNGRMKKGEPLPSIRALSADLKVSVITTKKAYEELEKEGLIYSVPGKGFFVDDPDFEYLEEKRTLGIEDDVKLLIKKAQTTALKKDDIIEMINILWED